MPTRLEVRAPAELTLDGVIAWNAANRPNDLALDLGDPRRTHLVTWQELEAYIRAMSTDLPSALSPGQVVAVICDDGLGFQVISNALWRRGLTIALIDRTWGQSIISDILELTNSVLLLTNRWVKGFSERHIPVMEYPALRKSCKEPYITSASLDGIAMYATTSGTTSNPKCIPVTHRRIRTAYSACLDIHDFSKVRQTGCLFSLNSLGVFGVCYLLPREIGASTRCFPAFTMANISQSWRTLLASNVDFVYLVPPLVRLLNSLPPSQLQRVQPILVFCAGAPVKEEELRSLETRAPVRIYNCYGLTELTFAVFFGCRSPEDLACESIGFPYSVQARIVDFDDNIITGAGTGELHILGPMRTNGYLNNPSATNESWLNGWLRTGDIAERDISGRYFIRGRIKDVIIRGGVTYYLHEIEHYLRRAPGVIDACAFRGRELPSGDELCVMAKVQPGTLKTDLVKWIRKEVGEGKVPNQLKLTEVDLPVNSNGKPLRNELRKQFVDPPLKNSISSNRLETDKPTDK
jgi:acyl-CoA synthetase (AMP-forming)/AMP-acid ligase II